MILRSLALALLLSTCAWANDTVKLAFVGDIMLDDGPGKVIASGRDPLAAFDQRLRAADFTIANLECPVATTGQAIPAKIFTFRAHPRVLDKLVGRIDAVSVANNHSGDYGKVAFEETLSLLRASHLPYFGGGKNLTEAHAPLWIEQKGLRIAVLGYNEFKPRSFEAGANWPGIAWSEDEQVIADIRAARAAGADIVIPFLHWGWERETTPSERQKQFARTMIDAGADAIVGGHPHVTQGADHYRGKPIIYSLGNFVFDSFDTLETRTGWLLELEVDKRGVVRWQTTAARVDDEGTPFPVPGEATPCGERGAAHPTLCTNP